MLEFFLAPEVLPFTVALQSVAVIGVFELVMILVAVPVLSSLDVSTDFDVSDSALAGALSWLHVGKLPLLALVVLFLSGFGLAGMGLQLALKSYGSGVASALGVSIPAVGAGVIMVRRLGGWLARTLMKGHQSRSVESFKGETVKIITGTARVGLPAEAKFTDENGFTHYVLVEPTSPTDIFLEGCEVVLQERTATGFTARARYAIDECPPE